MGKGEGSCLFFSENTVLISLNYVFVNLSLVLVGKFGFISYLQEIQN